MKKSSFMMGGALLLAALFTTSCDELSSSDNPVISNLTVSETDVVIPTGDTYQIKVETNNSTQAIVYKSSNPDVATVDENGLVTGVADGEAEITVALQVREDYLAHEREVNVAVKRPLTFEAMKAGEIDVSFNGFVPKKPVVYAVNGGDKQEMTTDATITVAEGDKVEFWSANEALTPGDGTWGVRIIPQSACAVYGNVMSMISPKGNYHTQKAITEDYALTGLLYGTGKWEYNDTKGIWEMTECYTQSHDKYKLTLPATTLTKGCYSYLLGNTGLTEVPELPATVIPDYSYQYMFYGCPLLTEAPAINVESVGVFGCSQMFDNCASLKKANAIHVKKVGPSAFRWIFENCTELTEAPAITAETVDSYGLASMFYGCANLEKANDITVGDVNDEYALAWMFSNCTSLTESPAISAKSLGYYACYAMFFNNQKMTKAKPINVENGIDSYGFNWMFEQCAELTESPEITAEEIGALACQNMFAGCNKLAKANAINVKTAGYGAFYYMFSGLPELTEMVALNVETMGSWACYCMFFNCPKLAQVPATLPTMNLGSACYQSMFERCTSLTEAPILPAETLPQQCYCYMFYDCVKLNKVTCLAKTNTGDYSLYYWLTNAGTDESVTTRTFVRSTDNNNWVNTNADAIDPDEWYIPNGWTITPTIEAQSARTVSVDREASAAPATKPVKIDFEAAPNVKSTSGASPAPTNLPQHVKKYI